MKICHLTSAHKSDDVRIFEKECVSLAKRGENEVYLVAQGDSFEHKNVKVVGVGIQNCGRLKRFFYVSRSVLSKALEIDADVYHLHDPELLLYAKKLKKRGKKVIFDSHEYYKKQILLKSYIPSVLRKIVAYVYDKYETRVCKYLDAAIFPCPMEGVHPFEKKVKLYEFINNVPILDEFEISATTKKYDTVCYVGSLTRERGIETLVDACYKANVKLILAGRITPKEFEDYLIDKEEFKNVDYRGMCSRDEVAKIYGESFIGACNIFNIGQYSEVNNLPTKAYEYMMCSMPVIISNIKFFVEEVKKYKFGVIVEPDNIDDIVAKILFLMNNRETAKKMGENGRKIIEEKYNWGIEERKLFLLYEKVFNS